MKRAILILIGLLIVGGIYVYTEYLRSVGPALSTPSENIADLLPPPRENGNATSTNTTSMPLTLPQGVSISIFAKNLEAPREMIMDAKGRIIVSIPSEGNVVALEDKNNDKLADTPITVVEGLNRPDGLALQCQTTCTLYIAESNQVARYDYNEKTAKATNRRRLFSLPDDGGHSTRTLLIHENKLLVAVGSSCNVCDERDNRRAKILSANLDGTNVQEFARGLRNAVFMTVHPTTSQIWVTEMGRDQLGDDIPPDEINIIEQGKDYGWPMCYGKNIHDTKFDKNTYLQNPCAEPAKIPSHIDLQAHSAPLGLAFIPNAWGSDLAGDLLVAYHGSWNRSVPTGYKVVRIKLNAQGMHESTEDFIAGWLRENDALGRPVDLLFSPSGELYLSDDKAGVVYRITKN